MIVCNKCNRELPDDSDFCQYCGCLILANSHRKVKNIESMTETIEPEIENSLSFSSEMEQLLLRGSLALEEQNWEKADLLFDKVLDNDPRNSEAYIGKLMADIHVMYKEDIVNCNDLISDNINFKRATRFSDSATKSWLESVSYQQSYIFAKSLAKKGGEKRLKRAIEIFLTIIDYKNSRTLLKNCEEMLNEAKRIFRNKVIAVVSLVLVALIVFLSVTYYFIPNSKYTNAIALKNDGHYASAIEIFEELDGYRDSKKQIENCKALQIERTYYNAVHAFEQGNYHGAIATFRILGNHKNAITYIDRCYREAYGEDLYNEISNAEVGDILEFGEYEQDNRKSNGYEPIQWIILEKQDMNVLLVSKYALDCIKYSEINGWLITTFQNIAFDGNEVDLITNTANGRNTYQHAFILSDGQIKQYFKYKNRYQCFATPYAVAQGAYVKGGKNSCAWWVDASGTNVKYEFDKETYNDYLNIHIYSDSHAIRPAVWIGM